MLLNLINSKQYFGKNPKENKLNYKNIIYFLSLYVKQNSLLLILDYTNLNMKNLHKFISNYLSKIKTKNKLNLQIHVSKHGIFNTKNIFLIILSKNKKYSK